MCSALIYVNHLCRPPCEHSFSCNELSWQPRSCECGSAPTACPETPATSCPFSCSHSVSTVSTHRVPTVKKCKRVHSILLTCLTHRETERFSEPLPMCVLLGQVEADPLSQTQSLWGIWIFPSGNIPGSQACGSFTIVLAGTTVPMGSTSFQWGWLPVPTHCQVAQWGWCCCPDDKVGQTPPADLNCCGSRCQQSPLPAECTQQSWCSCYLFMSRMVLAFSQLETGCWCGKK